MTDQPKKRRRLLFEMLLLVAICFALAAILYFVTVTLSRGLIEEYCFNREIIMDEMEWYALDQTLYSVGFVISAVFFVGLFLILFIERISYIKKITDGVHALRRGDYAHKVRIEGNNELTTLAEAVNYLSESEQQIKQKEQALTKEKEQLIRALSHDIRTPLTSIMSYTELLAAKERLTDEEQRDYLALVSKKTAQIKQLTDILLDGGHRNVEHFENACLLFEQLAGEFEEELENEYSVVIKLSLSSAFAWDADVQELRRIFDNLISNIQKYGDPEGDVTLEIVKTDACITLRQSNVIRKEKNVAESYQMGLYSIRRIAQNYGGSVETYNTEETFAIRIVFTNL